MKRDALKYTLPIVCALLLVGCNTTPVQDGAIAGGALGAGLGAIAGSTMGKTGEGALIGAGAGAITGALIGDHIEKSTEPKPAVRHSAPPPPPTLRSHAGRYEVRTIIAPSG
ncbi:MAG TPA: hypothetical protein ENN29_03230, partial [Candidatus Hydrogenedentes bacterium]|nr:hypothetical protein [Candidatus Hydrogenedentota bacterium]